MKAIFVSFLILTACVDQLGPDEDFTDVPKLAANGITPQQLWNAHLDANVLDATNLTNLAATADGRASGAYIIGCALAAGHSVDHRLVKFVGNPDPHQRAERRPRRRVDEIDPRPA